MQNQLELQTLQSNRILTALPLLSDRHFSIKEVAFTSGFNSPKYFTRCFKKTIGLTPYDYRSKVLPKVMAISEDTDSKFVSQLKSLIGNNLSIKKLNIDNLAFALNVSKSTLYRKIKTLTNLSVIEFINTMRFENAAQLLKTNRYSIFEVVYMVGFNDPKYFSKCFRQRYGYTPSHYKDLYKYCNEKK